MILRWICETWGQNTQDVSGIKCLRALPKEAWKAQRHQPDQYLDPGPANPKDLKFQSPLVIYPYGMLTVPDSCPVVGPFPQTK